MAKTKRRVPKELTRKQRSRLERERRMERILKWSIGAVVALVVGVLAYGFITENVVKARESVATVGEARITTAEFQSRVRFTRMQLGSELQYMYQQQQMLDPTNQDSQFLLEYLQGQLRDLESQLGAENAVIIGDQALEQLIQEELVRQEAQRRGISVSAEDVEVAIEQYFGYDRNPVMPTVSLEPTLPATSTETVDAGPTATPMPTPTPMTEAEFEQRYENFVRNLKTLKITEQQYRSWVEASLIQEKVQEQFTEETPSTADQVTLRYLLFDDQELADEAAARWRAGEEYEALLEELRADEEISVYGSEVEWLPLEALEGRFDPQLAAFVFEMTVGEISQPMQGESGVEYVVFELLGHEERELDDYFRQQLGSDAFQAWLEAEQVLVERGAYRDRVPTDP
jgi:parvulin-like peptidyl-prolyl isomerase